MLERCTPETKAAMDQILTTFGGEDGGTSYVRLCLMVEELDVRANSGLIGEARSAYMLVDIVRKFAKLIDAAKTTNLTQPNSGV